MSQALPSPLPHDASRRGQRPEDGRRANRLAVMTLLRHRSLGRADLSRELGLSKTALGDLVADLSQRGLITEGSVSGRTTAPHPGRKPAPLQIDARRAAVIGVDLSTTGVEVGVYDLMGDLLDLRETSFMRVRGEASIYEGVLENIRAGLEHARVLGIPILAIGVAAPGPLDAEVGVILAPPSLPELHHLGIKAKLEADLRLPVRLERDSTAAATAHLRRSNAENFIYLLLLDQGIGAGLVINRRVYRGVHGYAGEVGHVSLDVNGPACPCGNRGCLERIADVEAIKQAYTRRGRTAQTFGVMVERAYAGESDALEVLAAAGSAIGMAAAGLINILDPQVLVLGGVGARASPFLLPAIRRELSARAYPYLHWGEHLELQVCGLTNPVGRGAAECVLNAVYQGDIRCRPVQLEPTSAQPLSV